MVTHMKTTIDIADELLRQAKALAHDEDTTMKTVVETALREHLANRRAHRQATYKPVVVKGRTSPDVFQNLHRIILDTYEARDLAPYPRTKRR